MMMLAILFAAASCSKGDTPAEPVRKENTEINTDNDSDKDDSKNTDDSNKDDSNNNDSIDNNKDEEKSPVISDYLKGSRAQVRWKKGADVNKIDFDRFYRENDKEFMTIEYLSRWIELYVYDFDGNRFDFSADDLAHTKIVNLRYEDRRLRFKIEYKSVKSDWQNLSFDKNQYYRENFVRIDETPAASLYMDGVARNIREYLYDFVKCDDDKFILIVDNHCSKGENSLSFNVQLQDLGERPLASFNVTVGGFKSLSSLSDEMCVVSKGTDYFDKLYLRRDGRRIYLKDAPDGDVTEFLLMTGLIIC